jgi:hypothetical protein
MDYFNKLLGQTVKPTQKAPQIDHAAEFIKSWTIVKDTLVSPDERQLTKGIKSTEAPNRLQAMVDSLVWESSRTEEGMTGACMEYLLKNDVLGNLVRLSESDRPFGIQAEVLRAVQNMVVLLDEQFLVHSAVHRAVLRLLRNCVGDDLQEQLDGRNKLVGAAKNTVRSQPSEYEEDLVNLLCILCSRIRTHRELLMIFFHDKHWYRSEPLFSVDEGDEEEGEEDDDEDLSPRTLSPTPSHETITTAAQPSSKKIEYEFLLFNYLLRFVHREGHIGDFARAGLLFLMDVAMSPGEPIHLLAGGDTPKHSTTDSKQQHSDPVTDAALALAEYILDGDFSEVLGAGLGAVYSLLPYKLIIKQQGDSHGESMVLGGGIAPKSGANEDMDPEGSNSPEFRSRLDHFLKLMEFIQDVLRRNVIHESDLDASMLVGTAIVQSILDSVRRIFLENVLYPSVLECSDIDGSAVAVMSYVEIIISTLEDGPLSEMLVNFLMSEDDDELKVTPRQRKHSMVNLGAPPPPPQTDRQKKLHRRKSSAMMLLEMEAPESNKQTEYFTSMARFTLKDLLLANIKSSSAAAGTAALGLFRCLLQRHPHIAASGLLTVIPDSNATAFPHPALIPGYKPTASHGFSEEEEADEEEFIYPSFEDPLAEISLASTLFQQPQTTYATHEREMSLYLALVSRVDPAHNTDAFSTGFENYLNDALYAIQTQSACLLDSYPESSDQPTGNSHVMHKHRLNPTDSILSSVLKSLGNFFSNSPEYNVALTGLLATLAIHPERSLAGWMTFGGSEEGEAPETTTSVLGGGDGDDRSIDYAIEEKLLLDPLPASRLDEDSRPVIHTILHGLVAQLERYRQMVDDFDTFLLERRRGLLFNENLTDALSLVIDINDSIGSSASSQQDVRATTPEPKPKPKSRPSFMQSLLTPSKKKAQPPRTPSRSESTLDDPQGPVETVSASPFGHHYKKTEGIVVEPFSVPMGKNVFWSLENTSWNAEEEDVFSSGWSGDSRTNDLGGEADKDVTTGKREVTLSHLLDNVVILEESIKELAAIIHTRRSLGIDGIRYL